MSSDASALIIFNAVSLSVIRMAGNIALARLLTPSAFALSATTMLVLFGFQMISDLGITMMALRRGTPSEREEDQLWTIQIIRSFALAILLYISAPFVSSFYHTSELASVMRALALLPILQGLQSLYPVVELSRGNLKPSVITELAGKIVGLILSIVFALFDPTVWALVVGTLAASFGSVATSFLLARRRPRFRFNRTFAAEQWKFGRWIQASSTLTFAAMQIDKAIFPLLYGMANFGLYSIGSAYAVIPAQVTQRWSASVFYPLTANLLPSGPASYPELRRVRMTMLVYVAIAVVATIVGSGLFFGVLYKPSYKAAARYGELLAAGTFFEVAESSLRHMPAIDNILRYEVLAVLLRMAVFAILVAISWRLGPDAYALSFVGGLAASHLFVTIICWRYGYIRLWPEIAFGLAMLVVVGISYFIPPFSAPPVYALLLGGLFLGFTALGFLITFRLMGLPSSSR